MNTQWISTDPWGTPIKSDGPNTQPFMLFKSKWNFVKNIKRNVNLSYLLMKQIWGKKHTVSMRGSYTTPQLYSTGRHAFMLVDDKLSSFFW